MTLRSLLFLLLSLMSVLHAQSEDFTLELRERVANATKTAFTFLPDGSVKVIKEDNPRKKTSLTLTTLYPNEPGGEKVSTYVTSGTSGDTKQSEYLKETTVRTEALLTIRQTTGTNENLIRSREYQLDETGRPLSLTLTMRKIVEETPVYLTTVYMYNWESNEKLEVVTDTQGGPVFKIKLREKSLTINKRQKRKPWNRTDYRFNKKGWLISIVKISATGGDTVTGLLYRSNGTVKAASYGPFASDESIHNVSYFWTVKKNPALATITPAAAGEASTAIIDRMLLRGHDYRLLFPAELGNPIDYLK